MTLGKGCEEILRLIDALLDPAPVGGPTRCGQPALAVIPVPAATRLSTRQRATGQER